MIDGTAQNMLQKNRAMSGEMDGKTIYGGNFIQGMPQNS